MESLGSLSSSVKPILCNLGVSMIQALSLDQHLSCSVCSCFYITKLRPVESRAEMELIIHAFISSCLDYCNSLFTCLSKTSLNCLQVVQNAAAKLLTKSSKRSLVTPILISLHWLPIRFRIQFKILMITFRALHSRAQAYIKEPLQYYITCRNEVLWSGFVGCSSLKTN